MQTRTVRACLLVLGVAGLLAIPHSAGALQKTLAVTKSTVITNDIGESRLLIQFQPMDDLRNEWISSATLRLALGATRLTEDLDIQVDVPRTSWNEAASWSGTWTTPGGDPHDTMAVEWSIGAGRGGAALPVDVTDLVRGIQSGELPDNGFLIGPGSGNSRAGLTAAELAYLGTAARAELEVVYRKISVRSNLSAGEMLARKRARDRALDE